MDSARARLRAILNGSEVTAAAPIFDPLSARVADMMGWPVCKLSGSFGKFANLAVPDGLALANMSDLADLCRRITRVCDAALIADADEGGGNALNVVRTVRELEGAGVAAIEIEDNLVPRFFGEAADRHSLMIPKDEQVWKLKAAAAARRDPATVIVARTCALSELPREDALDRIRAYSDTGAEAMMFPELPGGVRDLEDISRCTDLPLLVLGLPADAYTGGAAYAGGVRVRFLDHLPYKMAIRSLVDAYDHLGRGRDPAELADRSADDALRRRIDRTEEWREWQDRFVVLEGGRRPS